MDTTVSTKRARISIGAILYFVYLFFDFVSSLPYLHYGDAPDADFVKGIVIAFLGFIPGIFFVISLLIRKPSAFITVSAAILTLTEFVIWVLNIVPIVESLIKSNALSPDFISIIIYFTAKIIMVFACFIIVVLSVASYVDTFRRKATLVGVIEIILGTSVVISCVFLCIYFLLVVRNNSFYGSDVLTQTYNYIRQFGISILLALLNSVSFVLIAFWLANPYEEVDYPASSKKESAPSELIIGSAEDSTVGSSSAKCSSGAGATATAKTTEFASLCRGYRMEILIHVLLLLLTSGIWQLIWIYRTTELVNHAEGEVRRDPIACLLLSIFVPFYQIYWVYVTSQRIDKMAKAHGITSDIGTMCLVLAFFIPVVPPIFMQDKINNIIDIASAT